MLSLLFCALFAPVFAAPEVNVGKTTIIGAEFAPAKVEFFGAIPFANPPLGELRLEPPVLLDSPGVDRLDAASFGPGCQQNALPQDMVSEDCLTLNIFRPAGLSANAKLPVMFWIYGGRLLPDHLLVGAASLYNGTGIVTHSVARGTPVIFVSVNYRVGPLGFPQGVEAGQRKALNLGLQDQMVGLQWIQNNIAQFGGDKSKVTIFGESAGAASISIHLLGTKIRNVARAAILESTATSSTFGPEHNEAAWQQFVAAIPSCASVANTTDTFDCIKKADSNALLQALTTASIFGNSTSFQPVIDGPGGLLPDRPSKVTPKAHLPSMIGSNLDEGALFTPQNIASTEEIQAFLSAATTPAIVSLSQQSAAIEDILELYPDVAALGSPFGTGNDTFGLSSQYKRFAAIFGDLIFQSPRRSFTQGMSEAGVKVFAYYFTDPDAQISPSLLPTPPAPGSLGITHSSEIFYVFNTLAKITPTAVALSSVMQDYWISFATNLDPNDNHGNKRPSWEQYTPRNQILMELNGHDTRLVPDNFRAKQIAFLQNNPDALHR
ncbi:esterase 1 [Crassisporium funariophilum]|nr:esterase 1 [Crassisporium funariophilum]